MSKKFFIVVAMLIIAVAAILLAAKHPTGPNTVSYEEPVGLLLSIGMIILHFLPPLILSLFNNLAVKVISAIYQSFIAFIFLVIIPVGLLANNPGVSIICAIGALVTIFSIVLTLKTAAKRELSV